MEFVFVENENNIADELEPEHVREILNKVCRRKTFSSVLPIFLNGKWRIAAPGLETAFYYNKYKARNFDKENPLHYIIYTPHDTDEVHFGTFENLLECFKTF